MNINETLKLNLQAKLNNPQNLKHLQVFSPSNKNSKYKLKNIRFYKLPKTLSQKLNNKIVKESLILSLREEQKLLPSTNKDKLKEKVKKNKEDVKSNCEKLKEEFQDKFVIINNYENQIKLLNEEKKEIMRTNDEIINLKNEQNFLLKNKFNQVQDDTLKQMDEIKDLKIKINDLTIVKENVYSELEKNLKIEEEKHNQLIKEYLLLSKKCEYYQIEYDKFDLFPDEIIKKNINLYDKTLSNEILTEENLKVKLSEKNFIRDVLINDIQTLQKKVNQLEEEQNEIKRKEKLYGKNLDMNSIKLMRNKNKKMKNNNNININNINNDFQLERNTSSSKRMKTVENKRTVF